MRNVLVCRIVQGEEVIRQSSMSSINATIQVPKLKMTRVHIPFTFRLLETGNNSFEGRIKICLTCGISCKIFYCCIPRKPSLSLAKTLHCDSIAKVIFLDIFHARAVSRKIKGRELL